MSPTTMALLGLLAYKAANIITNAAQTPGQPGAVERWRRIRSATADWGRARAQMGCFLSGVADGKASTAKYQSMRYTQLSAAVAALLLGFASEAAADEGSLDGARASEDCPLGITGRAPRPPVMRLPLDNITVSSGFGLRSDPFDAAIFTGTIDRETDSIGRQALTRYERQALADSSAASVVAEHASFGCASDKERSTQYRRCVAQSGQIFVHA